jgi:hypothetical protein
MLLAIDQAKKHIQRHIDYGHRSIALWFPVVVAENLILYGRRATPPSGRNMGLYRGHIKARRSQRAGYWFTLADQSRARE